MIQVLRLLNKIISVVMIVLGVGAMFFAFSDYTPAAQGSVSKELQKLTNPYVIVDDARHAIWISYAESDTSAIFTARLRKGFQFTVRVDGDQDAKWGAGPYDEQRRGVTQPTDDLSFGTGFGKACPQYIWSGHPRGALELRQENADGAYGTSHCGVFLSSFTVQTTASDRPGFDSIVYKIAKTELFGKRTSAHVLLEVLDDTGRHGYYSLANPLIIER